MSRVHNVNNDEKNEKYLLFEINDDGYGGDD